MPRRGLWIALIAAGLLTLLLVMLSTLFPDALVRDMDRARFVQLLGALAVVSAGVVFGRRFDRTDVFRNIAIWCGVFVVLILGYTFRNDFEHVGERVVAELVPSRPVRSGAHEFTLTASDDGSFYAAGTVNGTRAEFLIDTGASSIVLSPADAKRAGLEISSLDYMNVFESAHGDGRGAYATVESLSIGPIELKNVPVIVNDSPMRTSLLGLTFLRRLKSFEVRDGKLALRW